MEERNVYLIFTDTGTVFTRLIKMYTKKPLNHVSIAFDENLDEIYSFGRKNPNNPFVGGFVREQLNEGLFKKATCRIYKFTLSHTEYDQMKMRVKQFESNKHSYKYNLLGLFAILLKIQLNRKNAFFCSQFVATILTEGNIVLEKSPCKCTPHDIMKLEQLSLVYKGELNSYSNGMIRNDMRCGA